jgi:hypothetical protein
MDRTREVWQKGIRKDVTKGKKMNTLVEASLFTFTNRVDGVPVEAKEVL